MDFLSIAKNRQSCRKYDGTRMVEEEKLQRILEAARLAPSACNGQPYHITVCKGQLAKEVAKATQGVGINRFATEAPVVLVISEKSYNPASIVGAAVKKNDFRSIDIGILSAYITAEATAQSLGTCIIGWLDDEKIRKLCDLSGTVRLVITVGYPHPEDKLRDKKRKDMDKLVSVKE